MVSAFIPGYDGDDEPLTGFAAVMFWAVVVLLWAIQGAVFVELGGVSF